VKSAARTGDAIRRSFGAGTSVGSTAAGGVSGRCESLAVVVKATGEFDAVMIREDLLTASGAGQVVLGYSLELEGCATPGQWAPVRLNSTLAGQTVGMRSIARLPAAALATSGSSNSSGVCAVRFRCTRAIGGAQAVVRLHSISLHKVHAPPEHGAGGSGGGSAS